MVGTATLELNNGVKFKLGETYGLEVEDKKSQVRTELEENFW